MNHYLTSKDVEIYLNTKEFAVEVYSVLTPIGRVAMIKGKCIHTSPTRPQVSNDDVSSAGAEHLPNTFSKPNTLKVLIIN